MFYYNSQKRRPSTIGGGGAPIFNPLGSGLEHCYYTKEKVISNSPGRCLPTWSTPDFSFGDDSFFEGPFSATFRKEFDMTKVYIVPGGSLESYYEQTMNYLHAKYHNYPSNLADLHVCPDERSRQSYYEAQAREIASGVSASGDVPLGKMVV
jgi:hypothetical protein